MLYLLTFVLDVFVDYAENRPHYDAEVDAEVAKEISMFTRRETEGVTGHGREI